MSELSSFEESLPLVSIIIPTYNSRCWIGQAIDSILNQTYPNIEIIVVNDGSTDDTENFLQENYTNKIIYISQTNGGLGSARNTGIKHAKGEFICFLDADDLLLPDKIANQVKLFKQYPDYGVVYCSLWCFYDDEVEKRYLPAPDLQPETPSGEVFVTLLKHNIMVPHAAMVKRECFDNVGLFFEDKGTALAGRGQGYEDWDLWVRIAAARYHFLFSPERDILYRIRRNSMSQNLYKMRIHLYRVFAHLKEVIPAERLQPALNQIEDAATFEFGVGRAAFEKRDYQTGLKQMLIACRIRKRKRLFYYLFCLIYLLALPIVGYYRLEKSIVSLILVSRKYRANRLANKDRHNEN